jgi:hypothetical protein
MRHQKVFPSIPACLLTGAFLLGISILLLPVGEYLFYSKIPFSTERWREGDFRQRGRMVGNLRDSDRLLGLTREEVAQLLGAPKDASVWEWQYVFVRSHLFMDLRSSDWPEWLVVSFDERSGRVREVETRD